MSDAEIEACRHPQPQEKPVTHSGAPSKMTGSQPSALTYQEQVAAANARVAAQKALDNAPSEPRIGMSIDAADAMVSANFERSNAWFMAHQYDYSGSSRADDRWYDWSSCKKNRTSTARGTHEQWVCGRDWNRKYLYFDNGTLTAIQDSSP